MVFPQYLRNSVSVYRKERALFLYSILNESEILIFPSLCGIIGKMTTHCGVKRLKSTEVGKRGWERGAGFKPLDHIALVPNSFGVFPKRGYGDMIGKISM